MDVTTLARTVNAGSIPQAVRDLTRGECGPRMQSPDLHYCLALLSVSYDAPHCGNVFPALDLLKSSQSWDQMAAKFCPGLGGTSLKRNHGVGRFGLDQVLHCSGRIVSRWCELHYYS